MSSDVVKTPLGDFALDDPRIRMRCSLHFFTLEGQDKAVIVGPYMDKDSEDNHDNAESPSELALSVGLFMATVQYVAALAAKIDALSEATDEELDKLSGPVMEAINKSKRLN